MAVNVSEVIDQSPARAFHWRIIALCAFVTVIDGFDLVSMGMVVPSLSEEWGLEPSAFAPALSAALVGVLFGSAAAGSLGDSIGRRSTLIIMIGIAAVFMTVTVLADSMTELAIYRFFTGFGAGGSIPVAIAFTSEYMPAKRRNMLVALMYAGAALGSVVAGVIGPTIIAWYGWHGVFVAGGALTAIAGLLIFIALPESVRFVVAKRGDNDRAAKLLRQVNPRLEFAEGDHFAVPEETQGGSPMRELFADRRAGITLLVWLVFFANQFMLFFVGLWLPTIFVQGGLTLDSALYLLAVYNLGGAIGGPVLGWFGDRNTAQSVLVITYPLAAAAVAAIGFSLGVDWLLMPVAFFAGATAIGSSFCLGPLTASLYPTRARATGIGWALSIGRAGSIVAPLIGGVVLAGGPEGFFLTAAVAPLVCAAGIAVLKRLSPGPEEKM